MVIVLIYIYFISTLQQNHIILLSFIIYIYIKFICYNIILPSLMTQYSFNIILPSLMTKQSLRPGVDRKTMFYCTANVQGNHI